MLKTKENSLTEILSQIPVLVEVDIDDIEEIAKRVKLIKFPKDSFVFHQGDKGETFYVIKTGKVEILKTVESQEKKAAVLYPDNFFGEMALINDDPRNATVKCLEECELFVFNKKDFYDFLYL
jgi:CRP/FNR family cyclic AMP-dependent transcriptional regulator